jgi:hypothetical protein
VRFGGEDMVTDSASNANGVGKSELDQRSVACAWCAGPFEDTTRGDRRKVFCSTPCRMAFPARRWAEREFSARELYAVSSPCTAQRLASDSGESPRSTPRGRTHQRASWRLLEAYRFCGPRRRAWRAYERTELGADDGAC